jgi:hypothetical protein
MESCDILRLSLQNVDSRKVPHVRFERSKNAKECEKELADASVCTFFGDCNLKYLQINLFQGRP